VIFPAHGGNFATVKRAIAAARDKHPGIDLVGYTDLLGLTGFLGPGLVKADRFASGYLGPLGEKETDLILAKGMPALTSNGVLGDPRKASAAMGQAYLEGLADFIISELGLNPAG
jgi:creatinine amidohydrolase/Fe(II)-dependent formamide hydrolase-like protein